MANITKIASPGPTLATLSPPTNCYVSGLVAGEAIAAGDACYIKSDGKAWLTAVANPPTAAGRTTGFAAMAASVGEAVTLYTDVVFNYGASLTPGAQYYASATAGAIADAPSAGAAAGAATAKGSITALLNESWLQPIGEAVDATRIRLWKSRY